MSKTSIEWSEMTWNPVTGCTHISDGCKFCYAGPWSERLQAMGVQKYEDGFKVRIHPHELERPFKWGRPKLVFTNSMSDLFHESVPTEFIKAIFQVMNSTPEHTYQVLTKRPARTLEIAEQLTWSKNIWFGVSIENEKVMNRLTLLRKIPAKLRFLSLEPLIGPLPHLNLSKIKWVIAGGESSAHARAIDQLWVKEIHIKCMLQRVPFFFKQWGVARHNPNPKDPTIKADHPLHAKGGCQLFGKVYREMPEIE